MPPQPKHPSTRQRRNKASTARTLHAVHDTEVPPLPPLFVERIEGEGEDRTVVSVPAEWHEMTLAWWADVWASPMAPEYDPSDIHGLYLLARLVDAAWRSTSVTGLKDVLGELRLQRQLYGLTPLDRRRLQWEIERGEEAADKGHAKEAERKARRAPRAAKKVADPRSILEA